MRLAIDQPNYIPWKGYFDLIHDVDVFVFYNDVQYTSRDWRNRNKIITPNGIQWLSVPVGQKVHRMIYEVEMVGSEWQKNHYETLKFAYGKAPHFKKYEDFLVDVYLKRQWKYLFELDQYIIKKIANEFLGLSTKFADSRDYLTHGTKHERLLSLVEAVGGYRFMNPVLRRKIILLQKIIKRRVSVLLGRIMTAIRNTNNYLQVLRIRYQYWICSLMLERKHHTIYGDGEKRRGQIHGITINNILTAPNIPICEGYCGGGIA